MEFFSDINCHGSMSSLQLKVRQGCLNLGPLTYNDTPSLEGWGSVPSAHIMCDLELGGLNGLNNPESNTLRYNILHLNGLGDDDQSTLITQIAAGENGKLYHRTGNKDGWKDWTDELSPEESWCELIDSRGNQYINGVLVLKDQLRVSSWANVGIPNGANTETSFLKTYADRAMSQNLNELFAGTYVQTQDKNCTLDNNFPLEKAGLMHVLHTLSTDPFYNSALTNNKGVTQIYYPHSGNGFYTRSKKYNRDSFENWCAHRPHNVLADHVILISDETDFLDHGTMDNTTFILKAPAIQEGESFFLCAIHDNLKHIRITLDGSYIGWWARSYNAGSDGVGFNGIFKNMSITGKQWMVQDSQNDGNLGIFMLYAIRVNGD